MSNETVSREALAVRVQSMVRAYVIGRTESRTGLKFAELRRTKDEQGRTRIQYPQNWQETQPKVVQEAFLQMRARRQHQDFVEYFAGTICSVGQFLPSADYQELTKALLSDGEAWEDIRALAMIALSTLVNVARADDARPS